MIDRKSMMTPNERIISFLDNLPDTIRDNTYAQIILVLRPNSLLDPGVDMRALARLLIDPADSEIGLAKLHAAILVASILDFVFFRNPHVYAAQLESRADKMRSPLLKKMAIGMPLQKRHFDQANKNWAEIRQSYLNLEALHELQTSLVVASNKRKPEE